MQKVAGDKKNVISDTQMYARILTNIMNINGAKDVDTYILLEILR